MPRHSDSPVDNWASLSFAAAMMKIILARELEGETASSRLKQIGFMVAVYNLQMSGVDATPTNLIDMLKLSRPAIFENAYPLIERKLLVEETIKNTQNRGRATRFVIPQKILDVVRDPLSYIDLSKL